MKTIIKAFVVLITIVSMTSCARGCTQMSRSLQTGSRTYHIEQYSGGKLISTYDFRGILNNSENSDGYYFYQNDTLVEVSGDLIIKSTR